MQKLKQKKYPESSQELSKNVDESKKLLQEILDFYQDRLKKADDDQKIIDARLERQATGQDLQWDIRNREIVSLCCEMLYLFGDRIESLLRD